MKKETILTTVTFILTFFISINSFGQCQTLQVSYHHDINLIGTVDEIRDLQDSLATHFPNICKKVIIGTSVLGYDIVALKFSDNVNVDEAEPEVLLTSCIHGDEVNPQQVMMKLARRLCLDYTTDAQITNLINTREIWIIAVMNPDGLRGLNSFNRPNSNGIDLNRNYGYMWNKEDFDPYEYSEPETKATRDFILSRNFNLMIDYHSGLQGIIYPWYYKGGASPDNIEIEYLANQYDVVSSYPASEFAVTSGFDLYPTNGALVEFAYGSLGILAFSVELMTFTNPVFDNCQLYTINKPSIFMMIDNAGKGITGKITDATTGIPIQAKISIDAKMPSYSSAVNGDFHRFLRSGTYTITVAANGYTSETRTITTTNGTLITEDFQLIAATNYSAQKIITCRNFDNYADPAETWNALGVNDGSYYAIGDTGYVVLDMGLFVTNVFGNDITIHGNASGAGNAYELFYSNSIDGPWTSLGTGSNTTSYDLAGASGVRYFRVEDNGTGTGGVLGAGFHLDAITAVNLSADINNINIANNDISVYPNPTIDVVNFKGDNIKEIKSVRLFDFSGKLLLKSTFSKQLDLSKFNAGIYFIQLIDDNSTVTFKIIKK